MKTRILDRLLLVAVVTLCQLAQAGDIKFQNGRPTDFKKTDSGEAIPIMVAIDSAKARAAPSARGVVAQSLSFLKTYYLADTATDAGSGGKFYLLAEMDMETAKPTSFVGWVAEGDVLTELKAMNAEGKPGIYRKAIVINQWRQAKKGEEEGGLEIEGAKVFTGPGDEYEPVATLGLFSFFYIFKERSDNLNEYVLLGNYNTIRNSLNAKDTIIGWVPKNRVATWSTRHAMEFDKRTMDRRVEADPGKTGAKIFESKEVLEAYLQGKDEHEGIAVEPIAVEDPKVRNWNYSTQRFPLFDTLPSDKVQSADQLWHVGFIGDQIFVDGSIGATGVDLDIEREKLRRLAQEMKCVNLVVVMDSTGSMRSYFKPAADAVNTIASRINNLQGANPDDQLEIRISVVFYRDYVDEDGKDGPNDTYLIKRLPLTQNMGAVSHFLSAELETPFEGAGGDEPEAVFYAIDQAIAMAANEVADKKGFKALIVIGDKGNHPSGYQPPEPYGKVQELGVEDVAKRIEDAGYSFYHIHVVEESRIEGDKDIRLFHDQMRDLDRRLNLDSRMNSSTTTSDPKEVAEAIVDAAEKEAEIFCQTRKAMWETERGEIGLVELARSHGVQLTRRLTALMEENDIDPSVFVQKSVQVFDRGWIAEKDILSSTPQVRPMILVERSTLEQLIAILAGFVKETPSRQSVLSVWTTALESQIGEAGVDKSPKELIESHLGIPIRNKVLQKSLEEISNLNPEDLQALWKTLDRDLKRLRGVYMEKNLEVVEEPDADGRMKVVVKDLGTRKVWWQGGACEYGWIPLDEMP